MAMGPQAGGVMTTRPPAFSEMIMGEEPVREHKYPYTQQEVEAHERFKAEQRPTPMDPVRIREVATRLAIQTMRGPQFQGLLSGLDPKERIKFERDLSSLIERYTNYLMQGGEFEQLDMDFNQWQEYLGE